jgi:hypothetical protein
MPILNDLELPPAKLLIEVELRELFSTITLMGHSMECIINEYMNIIK